MIKIEEVFEKFKDEIYIELFTVLNNVSSGLTNPCYNPPVSSNLNKALKTSLWSDFKKDLNFDFEKFVKDVIYKKTKSYKLYRDELVWFLLLLSLHFSNKKSKDRTDYEISFISTYLLLLKYYTSLSIRYMSKFCDKTKAILSLETLSEKALFSSKNKEVTQVSSSVLQSLTLNSKIKYNISNSNIAKGLVYILDTVIKKYYQRIKFNDYNKVSNLITFYRTRVNQSFKAYAKHYYEQVHVKVENEDMSHIENAIHQIMSANSRSMVYISDRYYKSASRITDVSVEILKDMYHVVYQISNYDLTYNIVNIYLSQDRYKLLHDIDTLYEWLMVIRELVAKRTKFDLRNMLLQLITTNEKLNQVYESKSDSYKHKMIQGMGSVIALSIYASIRIRYAHISRGYQII
jgi:hypothetical protein